MAKVLICLLVMVICGALCRPADENSIIATDPQGSSAGLQTHHIWRRFVNPWLASGDFANHISNIRTKRSYDECEKLQLCRLHASRNLISVFELYFVNKENAKLWDHHARSRQDCERRFSGC